MAILIINNNQTTRNAVRVALVGEGYELICANSFNEAFVHLVDAPVLPELILLDVMMENAEGWQFLAVHQSDPDLRKIPAVLMSSVGVKNVISLQREGVLTDLVDPRLLLQVAQVYCKARREVIQPELGLV